MYAAANTELAMGYRLLSSMPTCLKIQSLYLYRNVTQNCFYSPASTNVFGHLVKRNSNQRKTTDLLSLIWLNISTYTLHSMSRFVQRLAPFDLHMYT